LRPFCQVLFQDLPEGCEEIDYKHITVPGIWTILGYLINISGKRPAFLKQGPIRRTFKCHCRLQLTGGNSMTLDMHDETVEWKQHFEGQFSFIAKQHIQSQA
jgi:hypothetical protein